jgi:hypothetical protein
MNVDKNVDNLGCKLTRIFSCKTCNFKCSKKWQLDRHNLTLKHLNVDNATLQHADKTYLCECGKIYTHRQSLSVHRKKCNCVENTSTTGCSLLHQVEDETNVSLKTASSLGTENLALLLIETVKQNQELQRQSQEFQQKMFEMMKDNMSTNNTMINSHNTTNNNKFNLNVFLNETCKDAMNIDEFIDSIQVNFEDIEYSGIHGFTEGLSRIFLRELNKLDVCKRPIHCSDLKREVFHIKGCDNSWENERNLIFKMIKMITKKNMFMLRDWKEAHPECMNIDLPIHEKFVKISLGCMGPYDNDVEMKEFNKIISKVAKATAIQKGGRSPP